MGARLPPASALPPPGDGAAAVAALAAVLLPAPRAASGMATGVREPRPRTLPAVRATGRLGAHDTEA